MDITIAILAFIFVLTPPRSHAIIAPRNTLERSSSLSVEKPDDVLVSSNGVFSAGFYEVGDNSFCFAIWFTSSTDKTTVWMANRDYPVNGWRSRLMLSKSGDLVLTDAGHSMSWSTNTRLNSSIHLELQLLDTGNLVLMAASTSKLWQSFDFPTDTLLPGQLLTKDLSLVSSRSQTNQSSGYYKLFFDNDNQLHLLFDGSLISSEYWPDPDYVSWENQRSSYNDSRVAWRCTCIKGFRIKDPSDQAQGCEPEFDVETSGNGVRFLELPHTEAWGYDDVYSPNSTYDHCRRVCLNVTNCKAFLLKMIADKTTTFTCYTKTRLLNLYHSLTFTGTLYVKLSGLGIVEFTCIFLVWCIFFRSNEDVAAALKGYVLAGTGFNKFSYAELKKATSNFKEEVGKGGSGSVYKGILSDNSVVAIKKLADATQGEAEFLAEMSIIGRLNHMNLIKMWGYCLEGTRRLLVFDFMERGSLAENLYSNSLSWGQRYDIALGTARGLSYLHEECLEWILHCDMKPQNILLDSGYQAKVADFGLSKLLDRDAANNASLSRIRGTRGYMAPEWVSNAPITSKVDVYSYGVVMLEVVTGKKPAYVDSCFVDHTLVTWVREKKVVAPTLESWLEEIVDLRMEGNYNIDEMKTLALTALQCVEEDKDARPTMKQGSCTNRPIKQLAKLNNKIMKSGPRKQTLKKAAHLALLLFLT
ncbi:putative receptor protein kinase ZmPK1 [Drosera capensis]